MMMPNSIKDIIVYVTSLDIILGIGAYWLSTLNTAVTNIGAIALSICGVIISIYTILHLREKWIGQKLDNDLKRKQLNN